MANISLKMLRISALNYLAAIATAMLFAIVLTAVGFGAGFFTNSIVALCIGSCMFLFPTLVFAIFSFSGPAMRVLAALASLSSGAVAGALLGTVAAGKDLERFLPPRLDIYVEAVLLSIITGFLYWYVLLSKKSISIAFAQVQGERIKRLTIEKQMAEANLKALQAQIEPHFLFNTLSTAITLLETDTASGRRMLEDLTAYLRMTLSKTRADATNLGQELEMIRSYLNIFKIRMGKRLNYEIDVPDDLKGLSFYPMLLQPIVENAVQHGLEPRIQGGWIWIKAAVFDSRLRISVADSGLSFSEKTEWGLGISNIKERLDAIYGGRARLYFEENHPMGLNVVMEVPV